MKITARLSPSSALALSIQVCDFMYNYLHNYSSLHPTVSGGLVSLVVLFLQHRHIRTH